VARTWILSDHYAEALLGRLMAAARAAALG
jgi:hypothetical protein